MAKYEESCACLGHVFTLFSDGHEECRRCGLYYFKPSVPVPKARAVAGYATATLPRTERPAPIPVVTQPIKGGQGRSAAELERDVGILIGVGLTAGLIAIGLGLGAFLAWLGV